MTLARENISLPITASDFQISGNVLRAFYDANDNLVFVIDYTINNNKPHALLIMSPRGNRKWDDILSNDFDINLETVRPKANNKYQKLDIDYTGLEIYDTLISEFKSGTNLDNALSKLHNFRIATIQRSAKERLDSAELKILNANDTIDKANASIVDLNARLSELRAKLKSQRSSVGREPTKQSAAKILRTESQIDAMLDKITRAQHRITNAKHRIAVAESDADAARKLLNIDEQIHEPKAEPMADEEIKPLFDKDPDVLDNDIAFKPIDFDSPKQPLSPSTQKNVSKHIEKTAVVQTPNLNLSFVPPLSSTNQQDSETKLDETFTTPSPILETMEPISTTPMVDNSETMQQPVPETIAHTDPAPVMDSLHPSSPVTPTVDVQDTPIKQTHPNILYYILLIVLITLSIFTLWIYQKYMNTTTPELLSEQKQITSVVSEQPTTKSSEKDLPIIIASGSGAMPTPVAPVYEDPTPVISIEPTLEIVEPVQIAEPQSVDNLEPQEDVQESAECADGMSPDENGCCAGETFTTLDDGVACCSDEECYPPMK